MNRLNRKNMFEPGQIVTYEHWDGLSNAPEIVKLLLLRKTQDEERLGTNDVPVVWQAYYLSGSEGKYIGSNQGLKDKNLVLVFEYALEL